MTNEERKALVERLRTFERWLYDMDLSGLSEVQPNMRDVADQIEVDGKRIAELEAVLREIADEKGECGWCGALAVGEGAGHIDCDCPYPYWVEMNASKRARAALGEGND